MKTFLFVLLVALSVSNVYGHCKYDGGVKGVGETIYIKDPYLVKETTDILHADGLGSHGRANRRPSPAGSPRHGAQSG